MKFLVDENLSHVVTAGLRDAGHESAHVADVGMRSATDAALIQYAAEKDFTLMLPRRHIEVLRRTCSFALRLQRQSKGSKRR